MTGEPEPETKQQLKQNQKKAFCCLMLIVCWESMESMPHNLQTSLTTASGGTNKK